MIRRSRIVAVLVVAIVTVASSACLDAPELTPVQDAPTEARTAGDTPRLPGETGPSSSATTMTADAAAATGTEDASKPPLDPAKQKACDDARGVFDGTTCTIACTATARCGDRKCPSGMPCKVSCTGTQACSKVECGTATSCDVRCEGYQACNGDVKAVNIATTTVTCDGIQACNGQVYCSGATCALTCANEGCTNSAISCCATSCTLNGAITECP